MQDSLTAIMVDEAVVTFGIWCQNRLDETDGKGNLVYTLDELLADELEIDNESAFQQLESIGFARRRKSRVGLQVDGQSE